MYLILIVSYTVFQYRPRNHAFCLYLSLYFCLFRRNFDTVSMIFASYFFRPAQPNHADPSTVQEFTGPIPLLSSEID